MKLNRQAARIYILFINRSLVRYSPFLLAPAEGRGPYWGPLAPSSHTCQTKHIQFGLMGIFVSRQPFRHLKHQNLSTCDDFINSSGIFFQFHFWPPGRQWFHFQMILSCQGDWYGCLDTLNIKICSLFQNLMPESGWYNNSRVRGVEG